MSLIPYNKPALTYAEQIAQLQHRGLIISNIPKTTHLLESISYYRLSGYWYPLLENKENHLFKKNSTFETAFSLYCFDKELRILIIQELEKIEVSIRAKMIYILSHKYGAFWYKDAALFKSEFSHNKSLASLKDEYDRSDAEFSVAFDKKYSDDLPPCWMLLELSAFGTLSFLYSNLIDKRDIANYFGLSDKVFASWLHSIVYLRNVCAHHSRLWNRVMSIQPIKPNTTSKNWIKNSTVSNNKTYYILAMILYLMQTINPKNSIPKRFKALLEKYPNVDVSAMGFPTDWKDEDLWK